jgi:Uma2 family endonuclease
MTTATAPAPAAHSTAPEFEWLEAAVARLAPGQRLTFEPVPWGLYDRVLAARDQSRRGVRVAFDRGRLELRTVTNVHERWKGVLARLLETLALALRVPVVASGNLTVRRQDLDRGLEPDECYYVQNAARMAAIRNLDFTRDPPPDLAVEIEITHGIGGKLDVYAALGVPEVWRFDGARLTFLRLTPGRQYEEAPASLAFPTLTAADLGRYLARAGTVDDTTLCWEFFDWVRQTLLPPAGGTAN